MKKKKYLKPKEIDIYKVLKLAEEARKKLLDELEITGGVYLIPESIFNKMIEEINQKNCVLSDTIQEKLKPL